MEYYLAIKKNEIFTFAKTWMDKFFNAVHVGLVFQEKKYLYQLSICLMAANYPSN